jgi:hypothetical protein
MVVVKIKRSSWRASQNLHCTEPRAASGAYGDLVGLVAAVAIRANGDWHNDRQEPSAELAARGVHSWFGGDLIKSVGPGSGIEVGNGQRVAVAIVAEAYSVPIR